MRDETPQFVLGPMAGALGLVPTALVPAVLGQGRGPQAEVGGVTLSWVPSPGGCVCAVLGGNSWGGGGASPFLVPHPSRLSLVIPTPNSPAGWAGRGHSVLDWSLLVRHWCDVGSVLRWAPGAGHV